MRFTNKAFRLFALADQFMESMALYEKYSPVENQQVFEIDNDKLEKNLRSLEQLIKYNEYKLVQFIQENYDDNEFKDVRYPKDDPIFE